MTGTNAIEDALLPAIEAGELAGAAALVWKGGAVREVVTVGRRDLGTGVPVERDTIFRIASMTKPVTSVCALTLLDEGRFDLDEPITRCAPEFAHMRVLRDPNGPLDQTDDAIAELQRAKADGYRTLIDFDYFVRIEDYPFMARVVSDPRFTALVAEIQADNQRMRDALLARRGAAASSSSTGP